MQYVGGKGLVVKKYFFIIEDNMQRYIEKYLNRRILDHSFSLPEMHKECIISIVIPAYNEAYLETTILSILENREEATCYEIIIVNNIRKDDRESAILNFEKVKNLIAQYSDQLKIYGIHIEFENNKESGVGQARKIGMDQALKRFVHRKRLDGLIVCLDADCVVAQNYISTLKNFYHGRKNSPAASIYFEHIIKDRERQEAIYQYELHLRYFIQKQREIGLPYAYHTIGSAMLVRADAYAKEGGMNKRKAGEDFYFLHKFTLDPHFLEINDTAVFPSDRESDRVPFGTGRAVVKFDKEISSYAPESFHQFQKIIDHLGQFEHYNSNAQLWLSSLELPQEIEEYFLSESRFIQQCWDNSRDREVFIRHFFGWFNPFRLMKYLHYCRDTLYPNVSVLKLASLNISGNLERKDLLDEYRKLNRLQWSAGRISNDERISAS